MFVDFFIRRPIFATVCALMIILAGAVSIPTLPIAQFPALAPPQVTVFSNYIGASAQVVESAVTIPLEQQINGAEGLKYLTSSSGNDGTSQIIATFDLSRDPDLAAVDIQNRVNIAMGRLPSEVKQTGVTVLKSATNFVFGAAVYAEDGRYDTAFMSNYLDVNVRDSLKRVKGVADVFIFGERRYAMRLWLDPVRVAARGLTASDVVAALREQNVQVAAGQVGQQPAPPGQTFQVSVRAVGRLSEPREFEDIIVKASGGTTVRLKDVGRVELGAEDYASILQFNGQDAVGIALMQLSNANALEVQRAALAEMDRLSQRFPAGMKYRIAFDTTEVVSASIHDVLFTLAGAIALVILVIFVFLEDWRTTLIPAVTIPVSLIGTFAFVKLLGFSINTLTLFGITLATGLVVDDAIVVIENIERHIHEGERDAFKAASAAMKEVTGAVIATSLVLVAVFVPVAFFPGTTGILFRQFALTIAFSIAISAFAALTLTPALSARLLGRAHGAKGRFFTGFDRVVGRVTEGYRGALRRTLGRPRLAMGVFLIGIVLSAVVYRMVPRAFVPDDDQGWAMVLVQAPEGASLEYTRKVCEQANAVLRRQPEMDTVFAIAGFSFAGTAPNRGMIFFGLKPYSQRRGADHSAQAVINRLRGELMMSITDAMVFAFLPPPVEGLGTFGGFQYVVQDQSGHTLEELSAVTQDVVGKGNQDPALSGLFTSFTANDPQFVVTIDREKAKAVQVPLQQITDTLQTYMGSAYVNDFDFNNRSYRVYVQADKQYRSSPKDMRQFYVRSDTGTMIPLDNLVRVTSSTTPGVISHYNLFRSAEINGSAAPGKSSGEAIDAMQALSAKALPQGFGYEWTGVSLEELQAGQTAALLFGLGTLVVYLTLAAQYESFVLPFIVLMAVPMALLGALGAQWLRGLQNDVYCQIGLVMLVGLASKNAILIVEFAEQLRARGLPVVDAAVEAARIRLRPILMTSFAFILGVVPLVVATGAGQAGRHSVGTTVFGGMIASTALNLFFIPVLYLLIEEGRERMARARTRP
jgi:HAE1 family hydrophobic/amphiphilic exporter-1